MPTTAGRFHTNRKKWGVMEGPVVIHEVMISYASPDKEVAMAICVALEARKIRCWIAPRDVEPGENYGSSIIHAIDAARIMVLVFSSSANKSKPVANELEHAAFGKASLKIIPFRIEDVAISDALALFLKTPHWLDAVPKSRTAAIRDLVELVSQKLQDIEPTPPEPPPPPIWKWIMAIIFVLLAAAVVVVALTWFWPTSNVPKKQQTQSELDPSSQKHDRPESSVGGRAMPQPMVPVPMGKFLMGSPTSERDRDQRESQHEVSVDAFWMDPTEVTNAAFQKFLVANASWQKPQVKSDLVDNGYLRDWENAEYPLGEQGNYPVTRVSWYAARAYCAWMKKRLPTEAEWEYAARAGTSTAYWWGDNWAPASAAGNSKRGPDPVGKQAHRNQWKLSDMLGNVKEWTSTAYKPYPYDASDGREDAQSVSARTLRGGSWADTPEYLRSAARASKDPNLTDGLVGFRCASSIRVN